MAPEDCFAAAPFKMNAIIDDEPVAGKPFRGYRYDFQDVLLNI
jgi:hypothetical protein